MKIKNKATFLIILLFSVFIFSHFTFASKIIDYSTNDKYSVYSTEKINIYEPVPITVQINDKDYLTALTEIKISLGCNILFYKKIGHEKFQLEEVDENTYKYPEGEKKLEFYVTPIMKGKLSMNKDGLTQCVIQLLHDNDELRRIHGFGENTYKDMKGHTRIYYDFYDYDFGIKEIPEGFELTKDDVNGGIAGTMTLEELFESNVGMGSRYFRKRYEIDNDILKSQLDIELVDGTEFKYNELVNGDAELKSSRIPSSLEKFETLNFDLGKGNIGYNCFKDYDFYRTHNEENKYRIRCKYYETIITEHGPIILDLSITDHIIYGKGEEERARAKQEAQEKKEEWKEKLIDIGNSVYFESEGENPKLDIEEQDSTYLYGYIVDIEKNPLPYLELYFTYDGNKYETTTDFNGNYEFDLGNIKIKDEDEEGRLGFKLSYVRDGTNYFKLFNYNEQEQTFKASIIEKIIKLKKDENKEINLIFDGNIDDSIATNLGTDINVRDHANTYFHMHEAVEFALEGLNVKLDHELPIQVLIGQDDRETLYSPDRAYIKIAKSDKSYGSSNRPRNREYHEFGHHLMYDIYGGWVDDWSMDNTLNHGGFLNPSTADSFLEGFAEFIALAIAKFHGYENPDKYAGFGSLEKNYKPWDENGNYEEFAVASLLWDMYDSNNEQGDSLTMSLHDIWQVIDVKRANFYEYYKAFIQRYPEKKDAINDLFILHGFFVDTREGNKKWDNFEAFRSSNNTLTYSKGNYFIDLSCNKTPCVIGYKEGFKIGPAANYHRQNRTQAVMPQDAFLEVDPNGPRYYTISIIYPNKEIPNEEYDIEMKGGLVFVNPLPYDIEANIQIKPKTQEFSYKEDFQIKNSELIKSMNDNIGEGSFAKHDFEFERIASDKDLVYAEEGFEPSYTNDDRKFEDIEENIEDDDEGFIVGNNENKTGFVSYLIWFLVIGGILIVSFNFFKNKNNKEKLHKTYQKKIIPNAKKIAQNTKKYSKTLAHKTKKTYNEKIVPNTKKFLKVSKKHAKIFIHKTKKTYNEQVLPKAKELKEKIKKKTNELINNSSKKK
ncbi:MAG: hypothetical protein ACOC3X_02970 [Nanoarchaeota archaeon]